MQIRQVDRMDFFWYLYNTFYRYRLFN